MVGEQVAPDSRVRKVPNRQSRSCTVCRLRKVKCDRVKPCHACCAHGYPSKCVYETVPGEEARPISQADEIRNLRAEIRDLRARIEDKNDAYKEQDLQRLDQLESLFESIRSAPLHIVDRLVQDIRAAHGGLKQDLTPPTSSTLPIRRRLLTNSGSSSDDAEEDEVDDDWQRMSPDGTSDSSSASSTISIINTQRPAVDVFVERFLDAFSPEVDSKHGRAGAIRAAAEIRMFSPLISDAFEAVSVAFFGRSIQDKRIEASGFRLYPRVLRGLQDALIDPEKSKAESTLVTVILLLAFEVCHVPNTVKFLELTGTECGTHRPHRSTCPRPRRSAPD
ncbi:hypothetical protein N7510_008238 [Penicillium lagena]|uniref:uncharacterized protein n=1 Tax=Penicillium lagena TaxID=94218 RepID=UPI00253F9924|nr:uncharacterized protein N7510_008238 [Penicillium lagena]KAJ5605457.1 hypothetical protein N7510_008238 [Penicillium lagena]